MSIILRTEVATGDKDGEAIPASITVLSSLNKEDREAVFRLRYEVYIAEQGKPYPEADHDRRMLSDPLDDESEILAVKSNGAVVGTVRASWFDSPAIERHYPMFGVGQDFAIPRKNIGMATRLVVDPRERGGTVTNAIFCTMYELAIEKQSMIFFASCNPKLIKFFQRYGFREFAQPYDDPVVGQLTRLVILPYDISHLELVRSPFLAIAREKEILTNNGPNFDSLFKKEA